MNCREGDLAICIHQPAEGALVRCVRLSDCAIGGDLWWDVELLSTAISSASLSMDLRCVAQVKETILPAGTANVLARDKWLRPLRGELTDEDKLQGLEHLGPPLYARLDLSKQPLNQRRFNMDNQHRQIKGYRELNQAELDLMNEIKQQGVALEALVSKLKDLPRSLSTRSSNPRHEG